jgi:hypothetical protein
MTGDFAQLESVKIRTVPFEFSFAVALIAQNLVNNISHLFLCDLRERKYKKLTFDW